MSLFVSDRKEVNAFSLNENMLIVDSTSRKTQKYTDIAGYVNNNKSIRLTGHPRIILKFTHNYTTKKKHSVVIKEYEPAVKRRKIYSKFL
jgi:hypothetical protein